MDLLRIYAATVSGITHLLIPPDVQRSRKVCSYGTSTITCITITANRYMSYIICHGCNFTGINHFAGTIFL